jgi:HK97 family phage major capsid protein
MKPFLKKYRHTISLLAICLLALAIILLGAPVASALLVVGLWQLSQFAVSKPRRGAFYVSALTPDQIEEITEGSKALKELAVKYGFVPDEIERLSNEIRKLRKAGLNASATGVRWIGNKPFVTDDCAKALTSVYVLDCARLENGMARLTADEGAQKRILQLAQSNLGIQIRAGGALNPTDIPLPTIYMPQIVELVFAYGAGRQYATVFPLGAGQVKLPRLKAGEDDFGYLGAGTGGQSQNIPQKEVTAELVTFNANKGGGLIRFPTEIEEDTFVQLGQFLARYIARQFAKMEDKTLFVGDGTTTFANQTGIATYCVNNPAYLLQLGAGKTQPSAATVDDFRNLRAQVNAAILGNMAANGQTNAAYYMHPSFEPLLRSFNKYPNFIVFETVNGKPMLDGWPVRWIGVSQPYSATAVAPNAPLAFFGDLSYWYIGERGLPRVEVSREVFFATDELALRALERIDVEAMAIDAMATLMTAAS